MHVHVSVCATCTVAPDLCVWQCGTRVARGAARITDPMLHFYERESLLIVIWIAKRVIPSDFGSLTLSLMNMQA